MVSTPWQDLGLLTSLRTCAPEATLTRIAPHIAEAGITRLAPLTDLDAVRLPVYTAIRPMATSLSTSQGKGMTIGAAKCSALMEALEIYQAENLRPCLEGKPMTALSCDAYLPSDADIGFPADYLHDWVAGQTSTGKSVYVLHAAVSMNTLLPSVVLYGNSTNGLASGNTLEEARLHGALEVIERASRKGCPSTVTALPPHPLFTRLQDHHEVMIDYYPNAYGLPVLGCRLQSHNRFDNQVYFLGYGCHLDKTIALQRAVTEAIQSKVTTIAGSRDDIGEKDYLYRRQQKKLAPHANTQSFAKLPTTDITAFASVSAALENVIERIHQQQQRVIHVPLYTGDYAVAKVFIDGQ